jgi:hypothetical protein
LALTGHRGRVDARGHRVGAFEDMEEYAQWLQAAQQLPVASDCFEVG